MTMKIIKISNSFQTQLKRLPLTICVTVIQGHPTGLLVPKKTTRGISYGKQTVMVREAFTETHNCTSHSLKV